MSQLRKQQLLEQLFKLGRLKEEYAAWLKMVWHLVGQKFPQMTKEQYVDVLKEYSEDRYYEGVKRLYGQTFSEAEMEEIIRFWSSEAGRKLVGASFYSLKKDFHTKWASSLDAACQKCCTSRQDGQNETEEA